MRQIPSATLRVYLVHRWTGGWLVSGDWDLSPHKLARKETGEYLGGVGWSQSLSEVLQAGARPAAHGVSPWKMAAHPWALCAHKGCQSRQGSKPPLHCRAVLVIRLHHEKNHCPLSAQKMHRAKSSRTYQKDTHPLAACWVLNGIPWCSWLWTDFWGPGSPVADAGLHVIFQSTGVSVVVWALEFCI